MNSPFSHPLTTDKVQVPCSAADPAAHNRKNFSVSHILDLQPPEHDPEEPGVCRQLESGALSSGSETLQPEGRTCHLFILLFVEQRFTFTIQYHTCLSFQ